MRQLIVEVNPLQKGCEKIALSWHAFRTHDGMARLGTPLSDFLLTFAGSPDLL